MTLESAAVVRIILMLLGNVVIAGQSAGKNASILWNVAWILNFGIALLTKKQ